MISRQQLELETKSSFQEMLVIDGALQSSFFLLNELLAKHFEDDSVDLIHLMNLFLKLSPRILPLLHICDICHKRFLEALASSINAAIIAFGSVVPSIEHRILTWGLPVHICNLLRPIDCAVGIIEPPNLSERQVSKLRKSASDLRKLTKEVKLFGNDSGSIDEAVNWCEALVLESWGTNTDQLSNKTLYHTPKHSGVLVASVFCSPKLSYLVVSDMQIGHDLPQLEGDPFSAGFFNYTISEKGIQFI